MQTSEHLDANSEPNPVDNIQPVQLTSPEMSESPVELARVRDDMLRASYLNFGYCNTKRRPLRDFVFLSYHV